MTAVLAAAQAERVEAAQQPLPFGVVWPGRGAGTSSTSLVSTLRRWASLVAVASVDRTLVASSCWAVRTPGATERACATAAANTAATRAAASACQNQPKTRAALARRAGRARGGHFGLSGVAGIQVLGQQGAQQEGTGMRWGARRVRAVAGVGVVAAEQAVGFSHGHLLFGRVADRPC